MRNHDQPMVGFHLLIPSATSSFLFSSRAFGVADSGRKWVLMREPKLAAMERLVAEASLWCLANLSLEGVLCWLGLQEVHRMASQQLCKLRIFTWPALKVGFSLIGPPRNWRKTSQLSFREIARKHKGGLENKGVSLSIKSTFKPTQTGKCVCAR